MQDPEQPQQPGWPGWRCSASGRWRRQESPGHRAQRRLRQMDRLAAVALASLARLQRHHGSAMPRILDSLLCQAKANTTQGNADPGDRHDAPRLVRASTLDPSAAPFLPAAACAEQTAESKEPALVAAAASVATHESVSEAEGRLSSAASAPVAQAPSSPSPPVSTSPLFLLLSEWNQLAQASWRHLRLVYDLAQFYPGDVSGGGDDPG